MRQFTLLLLAAIIVLGGPSVHAERVYAGGNNSYQLDLGKATKYYAEVRKNLEMTIPLFSSYSGIHWDYSLCFYNMAARDTTYVALNETILNNQLLVNSNFPEITNASGNPYSSLNYIRVGWELLRLIEVVENKNPDYTKPVNLHAEYTIRDQAGFHGSAKLYNANQYDTIPGTEILFGNKLVVHLVNGDTAKEYTYYAIPDTYLYNDILYWVNNINYWVLFEISDNKGNSWSFDYEWVPYSSYNVDYVYPHHDLLIKKINYPDGDNITFNYNTYTSSYNSNSTVIGTLHFYNLKEIKRYSASTGQYETVSIVYSEPVPSDVHFSYYDADINAKGLSAITFPNGRRLEFGGLFEDFLNGIGNNGGFGNNFAYFDQPGEYTITEVVNDIPVSRQAIILEDLYYSEPMSASVSDYYEPSGSYSNVTTFSTDLNGCERSLVMHNGARAYTRSVVVDGLLGFGAAPLEQTYEYENKEAAYPDPAAWYSENKQEMRNMYTGWARVPRIFENDEISYVTLNSESGMYPESYQLNSEYTGYYNHIILPEVTEELHYLPGLNEEVRLWADGDTATEQPYSSREFYERDYNPDGTVTRFGELFGCLKREIDSLGNATRYEYYMRGEDGKMPTDGKIRQLKAVYKEQATLAFGGDVESDILQREFKYNSKGLLCELIEYSSAGKHKTEYLYYDVDEDVDGLSALGLTAVDGTYLKLAAVKSGPYLAESDDEKRITRYKYNTAGLLVWQQGPDKMITEWEYYPPNHAYAGYLKKHTAAHLEGTPQHDLVITNYEYQTADLKFKKTETILLGAVEDRVNTYTYDLWGNLLGKTYPNPEGGRFSESYEYDNMGNLVKYTDVHGNYTEYVLNKAGWVLQRIEKDVDGAQLAKVSYRYDTQGNITARAVEGGKTIYSAYDNYGRRIIESEKPIAEIGTEDNPHCWYRNAQGRITKETDLKGNTVIENVAYNEYGDILKYEKPFTKADESQDAIVTHLQYDKYGRPIVNTLEMDPEDGPDRQIASMANTFDETISASDNEFSTDYVYDNQGRCVASKKGNYTFCTYYNDQGTENPSFAKEIVTFKCASNQIQNADDIKEKHDDPDILVISRQYYNIKEQLIKSVDQYGNVTFYNYDILGNLTGIQLNADPAAGAYDPGGDVITMKSYPDLSGTEREVISLPMGDNSQTVTDAAGKVLNSSVNGLTTEYEYYEDGRVRWITGPASTVVTNLKTGNETYAHPVILFAYDNKLRLEKVYQYYVPSDQSMEIWHSEVEKTDPIIQYQYDENSNIVAVIDANGYRTAYITYDELNRPTSNTDQANRMTKINQTKAGDMKELVDAEKNDTAYAQTDSGLPQAQVLANGSTALMSYTPQEGLLDERTDPNGDVMSFNRNMLGQLANVQVSYDSGLGTVTERTVNYDDENPNLIESVIEHNASNGKTITTSYSYYPNSSLVASETTTIQNGPSATVAYTYDNQNRIQTITYPSEAVLEYVYEAGRIKEIWYDGAQIAAYTYDDNGSITKKELNGNITTSLKTDYRGFLYQETSGNKNEIYHRHKDGRMKILENIKQPAESVKYEYDSLYRLTALRKGYLNGTKDNIDNPLYEETYSYDKMGNITDSAVYGGEIPPLETFVTDTFEDGDLATVGGNANLYIYNQGHWWEAGSQLDGTLNAMDNIKAEVTFVTQPQDVWEFSSRVDVAPGKMYAEPTDVRLMFSGNGEGDYSFAAIKAVMIATAGATENDPPEIKRLLAIEYGMVEGGAEIILASEETVIDLSQTVLDLAMSMAPDGAGRDLTFTVTCAAQQLAELEADLAFSDPGQAGVIVNQNGEGYHVKFHSVRIDGVEYDPDSISSTNEVYQYDQFDNKTCQWDANGNLISWDRTYEFDAFNRMTKAGASVKYYYDSNNRRIAKEDNGIMTYYIYNGWSVIAELDAAGNVVKEYVDGISLDEHLAMIDTYYNQTYYYSLDTRNGVEALLNSSGQVVETYEYTAYGETTVKDADGEEITWEEGIGNPYGFQGRRFDAESGLMYFRHRMFSPEMKRFVSMDPAGFVDSYNLYETFACDPVNYVDPWGLDAMEIANGEVFWVVGDKPWFGSDKRPRYYIGKKNGQLVELSAGLLDGFVHIDILDELINDNKYVTKLGYQEMETLQPYRQVETIRFVLSREISGDKDRLSEVDNFDNDASRKYLIDFARAGQGVVNAYAGGMIDSRHTYTYGFFNKQWEALGEASNVQNSAFQSGELGGATGIIFATGAGAAQALSLIPAAGGATLLSNLQLMGEAGFAYTALGVQKVAIGIGTIGATAANWAAWNPEVLQKALRYGPIVYGWAKEVYDKLMFDDPVEVYFEPDDFNDLLSNRNDRNDL